MAANDPAFPVEHMLSASTAYRDGLTKREWFAGMALQGILAGGFADTIPHDDVNGGGDAAYFALMYADALLSASGEGG